MLTTSVGLPSGIQVLSLVLDSIQGRPKAAQNSINSLGAMSNGQPALLGLRRRELEMTGIFVEEESF